MLYPFDGIKELGLGGNKGALLPPMDTGKFTEFFMYCEEFWRLFSSNGFDRDIIK